MKSLSSTLPLEYPHKKFVWTAGEISLFLALNRFVLIGVLKQPSNSTDIRQVENLAWDAQAKSTKLSIRIEQDANAREDFKGFLH